LNLEWMTVTATETYSMSAVYVVATALRAIKSTRKLTTM
jgi:ribosomal protein L28